MGQERCAGALAAKHRVRWTRRRAVELGGRDTAHAAVEPGLLEDRLGELGPRAVTLGCDVPDPARQADELARRGGQMADIRGTAALVVDDRDFVPLRAEREHRAQEVATRPAEEPGRADDPRVLARGSLRVQLRAAVRGLRARRIGFEVRRALSPVEDVVGRERDAVSYTHL